MHHILHTNKTFLLLDALASHSYCASVIWSQVFKSHSLHITLKFWQTNSIRSYRSVCMYVHMVGRGECVI